MFCFCQISIALMVCLSLAELDVFQSRYGTSRKKMLSIHAQTLVKRLLLARENATEPWQNGFPCTTVDHVLIPILIVDVRQSRSSCVMVSYKYIYTLTRSATIFNVSLYAKVTSSSSPVLYIDTGLLYGTCVHSALYFICHHKVSLFFFANF